jgi:hypothetical protein
MSFPVNSGRSETFREMLRAPERRSASTSASADGTYFDAGN